MLPQPRNMKDAAEIDKNANKIDKNTVKIDKNDKSACFCRQIDFEMGWELTPPLSEICKNKNQESW